jgi:hypothetical protein
MYFFKEAKYNKILLKFVQYIFLKDKLWYFQCKILSKFLRTRVNIHLIILVPLSVSETFGRKSIIILITFLSFCSRINPGPGPNLSKEDTRVYMTPKSCIDTATDDIIKNYYITNYFIFSFWFTLFFLLQEN